MPKLNRDGIVATAIGLADRDGLDAVSMRRVAQELGVDPMSLYHHIGDKQGLVDAMIDGVVGEIEPVDADGSWGAEVRALVLSARATMLRHPWAAKAIAEQEQPGSATLAHLDRVLGTMREGGCSVALGHHAIHVLGSRILGFSQDLFDDSGRPDPAASAAMAAAWKGTLPALAELAVTADHDGGLGGCDDDDEFAFSLDLILDGLERRRLEG